MTRLRSLDWSLILLSFVLVCISIVSIYTITYVSVGLKLTLNQILFAVIGYGLLILFSLIDYRHIRAFSPFLFISGLLSLLPMLPWLSSRLPFVICEFNSCRWLNLGLFRFQTSEVFKLIIIIFFSGLLANRIGKIRWQHLITLLVLLAIPIFFIMEQPDLGTALVVGFCGIILFVMAKVKWWIWLIILFGAMICAPIVWHQLKPYQKQRIEIFLHPEQDPNRTGYNVRQAEIAVGSGGLIGRGLGRGSQSQLNFLPVAHTDFIFSGYAEATGFVGSVFLLVIFGVLLWRIIRIAETTTDSFGRLLAIGITTMLAVQIVVNIGMNIRLVPVTGIPLPFISYGGTSLFVNMTALGIVQSIIIRHKKMNFATPRS